MPDHPDLQQTVIASVGENNGTGVPQEPRPRPALVAGTAPALSSAVTAVLRDRLKIASILLFCGFTAFFIRGMFDPHEVDGPAGEILMWSHLAFIVISGGMAARLCRRCEYSHGHLRFLEGLLFGLPALLFATWDIISLFFRPELVMAHPVSPKWIILVFTYALLIPNSWKRAVWSIGIMSLLPVVLVALGSDANPDLAGDGGLLDFVHRIPDISLGMIVTGVTATWGVYAINTLRKEAFAARQLGQYQLSRQLGAGGMGEVYLAEHMLLKRPCAIKVIRPDHAADSQAIARFEREVRATSRLTHWNTVEIFDYGRADDGTFYYVMEYLPGLNLEQLVQMQGPLPASRVIHLLSQMCDALKESHQAGLIHRDIKPANVFAAFRGGVYDVIKLLDFGLARPMSTVAESHLTHEGSITGSPLFTSPEQAVGDEADERSDIYSVGVLAWWLLTGQLLFDDENPLKVLVAHATQMPRPPSEVVSGLSQDLEQVVMRCLEKKPDDRFSCVEALQQALHNCGDAGGWTQQDASVWWTHHGCPEKKRLDEEVLAATVMPTA